MTEQQKYSIVRAAGTVGIFTALAKTVAFLKISLISAVLASGPVADEFQAAFRLPDFFYNLLVLGTLSLAFIPVFVDYYAQGKKEEAQRIANTILTLAFLAMSVLMLVLLLFLPQILHIIVPGFSGEKFENTLTLTRIMLLSPILFTVSSVFYGVLNSWKRFLITSLAPVLYNLSLMFGVGYLYPRIGLNGLAYGVVFGALLHLGLQAYAAKRAGFKPRFQLDLNHPGVKKIAKLFLPRIFGVDVGQFSLLIATIIGSALATGTIANFNYAYDIAFVPVGIFAVAFAITSFPSLSEAYTSGDDREFNHVLVTSAANILFFMIPFAVLFIVLRAQIARVVIGHGAVNFHTTKQVANSLGILAISMFAQGVSPLFSRAFYARHNTITPMLIGFVTMLVNALVSYFASRTLGVFGLVAGFNVASIFNALLLFLFLRASVRHLDDDYLLNSVAKISVASVLMGIVCYLVLNYIGSDIELNTTLKVLFQGFVAGAAGILVFAGIAKLLAIDQAEFIFSKIKSVLHR